MKTHTRLKKRLLICITAGSLLLTGCKNAGSSRVEYGRPLDEVSRAAAAENRHFGVVLSHAKEGGL